MGARMIQPDEIHGLFENNSESFGLKLIFIMEMILICGIKNTLKSLYPHCNQ